MNAASRVSDDRFEQDVEEAPHVADLLTDWRNLDLATSRAVKAG